MREPSEKQCYRKLSKCLVQITLLECSICDASPLAVAANKVDFYFFNAGGEVNGDMTMERLATGCEADDTHRHTQNRTGRRIK